jgi:hypothetical protein
VSVELGAGARMTTRPTAALGAWCAIAAIAVAAHAGVAFADAVAPAPEACPDGLVPEAGHDGPRCAVVACAPPSMGRGCPGGSRCEHRRYCAHDAFSYAEGERSTERVWTRACGPNGECDAGDRCEEVDHCVPWAESVRGRVELAAGAALGTLGTLAAVVIGIRRRRRAEPRARG